MDPMILKDWTNMMKKFYEVLEVHEDRKISIG